MEVEPAIDFLKCSRLGPVEKLREGINNLITPMHHRSLLPGEHITSQVPPHLASLTLCFLPG